MIEALVDRYTNGNKSKFASILGVTPQTINTWITRNTFDIELLFAKCEGISAEWLLTGEGSIIKGEASLETPPVSDSAAIKMLIDKIEEQAKKIERLELELEHYRSTDAATATP